MTPLNPGTLEFDFKDDGLGLSTLALNRRSGLGRGGTGVLKIDRPKLTPADEKRLMEQGQRVATGSVRKGVGRPHSDRPTTSCQCRRRCRLCARLSKAYSPSTKRVTVKVQTEAGQVGGAIGHRLGLILQKLLSNGRWRFGVNTTTAARILIVEDERIVAIDLQRRLTQLGYTVVALAASGMEAVQKALALRPDVVLMDIRLQGDMDGVEAAQQIQAATAIPVVFMTSYVDEATQQRIRTTSPWGCLYKPFIQHQIQATMELVFLGPPPDA
jgi:CheY-like chemotaxis protein